MASSLNRDDNRVVVLGGVTDDSNLTPTALQVNSSTKRLKVSAIITSGGGITSLNAQTGGVQTFANDTNVTITSATDTHTLGWTGQLDVSRGGTGASTLTGILKGNGTSAVTAVTAPSGTIVGTSDTQTLTNKSLVDASTSIVDDGDATRVLKFQCSGITAGNTRTLTVPDYDGSVATLAGTETFTNKTLTSPKLNENVAVTTTATKLNYLTSAGGTTGTTSTNIVFSTSPTLTTPTLGVATATSINKMAITAPATSSTLAVADGKTLTASNTLTLAGTDSTTMTFPSTSATIARTDAGQTFTGVNVFTSPKIVTQISDTNGNVLVNIGATASAVNYVKVTNAATGTAGPILAADGETNVDLKLAGKGTGAVHYTTGSYGDITADSDGATVTFNCATSNIHSVTLGGNRTLALSNDKAGQCILLRLKQDGTGSRTVTWFSGISWAGGSAPTLTTTANKADMIGILVTTAGSAYDGFVVGANI
jgi:hypothetical protein